MPLLGKIALDQVGPLSPHPRSAPASAAAHPLPPAVHPPPTCRLRPPACFIRIFALVLSILALALALALIFAPRPLQTFFALYINAAFCVLTEALQRRPLRDTLAKVRPRTHPPPLPSPPLL